MALELELFTFKIRVQCSTCEGYRQYAYECPSIKYSKCGEFEYYDYQCLTKSEHTDNVQIVDIDNSRFVEDVHIPSEVISDIDEFVKSSTRTLDKAHVHEGVLVTYIMY